MVDAQGHTVAIMESAVEATEHSVRRHCECAMLMTRQLIDELTWYWGELHGIWSMIIKAKTILKAAYLSLPHRGSEFLRISQVAGR